MTKKSQIKKLRQKARKFTTKRYSVKIRFAYTADDILEFKDDDGDIKIDMADWSTHEYTFMIALDNLAQLNDPIIKAKIQTKAQKAALLRASEISSGKVIQANVKKILDVIHITDRVVIDNLRLYSSLYSYPNSKLEGGEMTG